MAKSIDSREQSSTSSIPSPPRERDPEVPEQLADPSNGTNGVVEKVLSRTRSRSSYIDPGPPPDGGLKAWTQALSGHLIVCNTWGYIVSFGVFQTYYVGALGHPPSDISWVGSVQIFLLFFIGTFSGRVSKLQSNCFRFR